jgi:hypothetical protein
VLLDSQQDDTLGVVAMRKTALVFVLAVAHQAPSVEKNGSFRAA